MAAIIRAPWITTFPVSIIFGLIGLYGIIYILSVSKKMRLQTAYRPIFSDWFYRILLPLAAYLILEFSAVMLGASMRESLWGIGLAVLILLFTGIHNAWDNVAYHVLVSKYNSKSNKD